MGLSIVEIEQMEAQEELARVLQLEEIVRKKFNFIFAAVIDRNHFDMIEGLKSSIHGFYKELFGVY